MTEASVNHRSGSQTLSQNYIKLRNETSISISQRQTPQCHNKITKSALLLETQHHLHTRSYFERASYWSHKILFLPFNILAFVFRDRKWKSTCFKKCFVSLSKWSAFSFHFQFRILSWKSNNHCFFVLHYRFLISMNLLPLQPWFFSFRVCLYL